MNRRQFLKRAAAGSALLALQAGCGGVLGSKRKVLVVAFDGLDPGLVRRYTALGLMPNTKRLMQMGSMNNLATSNPPQSPVAWSGFITGGGPDLHGIFDFVHRDPKSLQPYLSTSRVNRPDKTLDVGNLRLPLSGGGVELLRKGEPFWKAILARGVPVTMVKLPVDFPAPQDRGGRFLSGMGTPDIRGSQGSFTFFTDDPRSLSDHTSGGVVVPVRDYGDGCYRCRIAGPANSLIEGSPVMETTADVWADRVSGAVRIDVQGRSFVLGEKQWSPWVRFSFPAITGISTVGAIGRFYLKELSPRLRLYLSPLNIDPENPALPISGPDWFARSIAEAVGPYYTQGFPEDTKALSRGVFDDDDYFSQATNVFDERLRMFTHSLNSWNDGLLFFYFSSTDLNQHMFYRTIDPESPLHSSVPTRFRGVMGELYAKADRAVGQAMELLDGNTEIMIISDHGFAPFNRAFGLNSWLAAEGYAHISRPENRNKDMFACLDWSLTAAYGLGLNSLYLNLAGREPDGTVTPGEKYPLLQRLSRDLESVVDPLNGRRPVEKAYIVADMFPGKELPPFAPDMVVGYSRGYRCSWETALGAFPEDVITDNTDPWSGDHCVAPILCPGSLITSTPMPGNLALQDMGRVIGETLDGES